MKRAQLIGFSVAIAAAVVAFYVASSFVQPPPAPVTVEKQVDSTEVLVGGRRYRRRPDRQRGKLPLGLVAD